MIPAISSFLTFARFHTKEETEHFASKLDREGIPFEIEHDAVILDKIYVGENFDASWHVKLMPQYFEQANALLRREAEEQIDHVADDYYLFQFSVAELKEVINKPDEWNYFDRLLAAKLLKEELATEVVVPVKDEVVEKAPTRVGWPAIVAGYVCGIFLPFYSIPMGAIVLTAKRTQQNGLKVHMFDKWSQQHGGFILALGIVGMARYAYWLFSN